MNMPTEKSWCKTAQIQLQLLLANGNYGNLTGQKWFLIDHQARGWAVLKMGQIPALMQLQDRKENKGLNEVKKVKKEGIVSKLSHYVQKTQTFQI